MPHRAANRPRRRANHGQGVQTVKKRKTDKTAIGQNLDMIVEALSAPRPPLRFVISRASNTTALAGG
jgi:hypothetical protein